MSRKFSRRNVAIGEKIKINDKRPLPEDPLEMTWKVDHIDGYRKSTANKISFPDLVTVKPITASAGQMKDDNKGRMVRLEDSFDILHERLWDYECFDSGSSSWDQSATSFMSWSDEIEAATTEKVQVLMDNLECLLYGEETLNNPGKNLVDECAYWRNKFPHLRIKGAPICIEPCEEETETYDENFEEIFAIDEADDISVEGISSDFDEKARNTSNSNSDLQQKVKEAVVDHLVSYISSEVLKSLFQKHEEETTKEKSSSSYTSCSFDTETSGREFETSPLRTDTPFFNNHESDLDSILLVSPKSLHLNSKISPVMSRQESATCSRASFHPLQISDIRANTIDYPSFSVLGAGRQVSTHNEKSFSAAPCSLTDITFHSATERRKKNYIDRRFSCGTLGHTKFLQPLDECQKKLASTSKSSKGNDKHVQSSVPNSPDKINRHFILPPIENTDVSKINQMSASPKPKSWLQSSRPSTTSSKQQVPLSPINIPDSSDLNDTRLSRLEIKKELLKKSSHNGKPEHSAKQEGNFISERRRNQKIKTNLFD